MDLSKRLRTVKALAAAGRFEEMQSRCQRLIETYGNDPEMLSAIGALLLSAGLLSLAYHCFQRILVLAPQDPLPRANLANAAREAGVHRENRRLYADLLRRLPDHPVIRRNALVSLEYDAGVGDAERRTQAEAWGAWAIQRAGGARPRPPAPPLADRPLRVGYISADFCQHTVGLLVKPVLRAHAAAGMTAFAYSAGAVQDWVTDEIRAATAFRDVAALNDSALAAQIRQDAIDVLVDLSGHTAGSRLTLFAHRPAPVQVSWLGYFASTGLDCIDAVLLDAWHAPPGMETQFVDPILRLPHGRLCYQPVPWAPAEVAPPPSQQAGCVTFGSFNNTAKLNDDVIAVWSRILAALPASRLLLKWRTFNDAALRHTVRRAFAAHGIAPDRIELRGPSSHMDLLPQYAELDIALDPFPFAGGLTSCEALWMGVPVVSWPQSRVVSRQGLAILASIGLAELAATDADSYVRIAVALAGDATRRRELRRGLRDRMRASPLMDVAGFTNGLRQSLRQLYQAIAGG